MVIYPFSPTIKWRTRCLSYSVRHILSFIIGFFGLTGMTLKDSNEYRWDFECCIDHQELMTQWINAPGSELNILLYVKGTKTIHFAWYLKVCCEHFLVYLFALFWITFVIYVERKIWIKLHIYFSFSFFFIVAHCNLTTTDL